MLVTVYTWLGYINSAKVRIFSTFKADRLNTLKSARHQIYTILKQLFSCDCGNVMECIVEDDTIKPKFKSISGKVRLRCNDCGKEHEVFLKHKIAKFVGASPSFKEISHS